MSEHSIKEEAQGETQTSLRRLLRSHWLLDFTWTLHDIPTALSGLSNGEIQLSPGKCTSAHCVLDKSLCSRKCIQNQLHIQYGKINNFNNGWQQCTLENSKQGLDWASLGRRLKSALLCLSALRHLFISERTGIQVRHNDGVWEVFLNSSPSRMYSTCTEPAHLSNRS